MLYSPLGAFPFAFLPSQAQAFATAPYLGQGMLPNVFNGPPALHPPMLPGRGFHARPDLAVQQHVLNHQMTGSQLPGISSLRQPSTGVTPTGEQLTHLLFFLLLLLFLYNNY